MGGWTGDWKQVWVCAGLRVAFLGWFEGTSKRKKSCSGVDTPTLWMDKSANFVHHSICPPRDIFRRREVFDRLLVHTHYSHSYPIDCSCKLHTSMSPAFPSDAVTLPRMKPDWRILEDHCLRKGILWWVLGFYIDCCGQLCFSLEETSSN